MKTLEDCFNLYNPNKFGYYIAEYTRVFTPIQSNVITLLEIGIGSGNSLKMFSDFFVNGKVYGIDNNSNSCIGDNCFCGSQSDINFLDSVEKKVGGFDIVIDDGSHFNLDQQISFNFLFPKLRKGGVYVIEDMHDGRTEFMNALISTKRFINLIEKRVEVIEDIGFIYRD